MNSKQVNETVNKLVSFMQDVKDGDLRTILVNMQKMNDYMAEKLHIYEEHLSLLTGKDRLELTDSDKRRLAQKGKELNNFLLAAIEPTWAPGTIRKWYSDLMGAKYNSIKNGQKKRGRKPISPEIVEKVLQLVKKQSRLGIRAHCRNNALLGQNWMTQIARTFIAGHVRRPPPPAGLDFVLF